MEFNNYSQSSSKNLHSWGIAVLLIVTAIWGTSYPLIKGLVNNLSPSVIFATRFVIAALPFTPYLRFLNISLLRDGALLGLIIFASSTFQTFGLETTSANRAAFIASFNVIIVPLVGQILGRQVVLKTLLTAAIAFQVDFDLHIELDEPAQLINHSCSPNTGIRNNQFGGYDFIALFDIPDGTEITWDYSTTEFSDISIPQCYCGSLECRSNIRGFKFLSVEIKKKYGEFIADY
ncbi:MAG: EamA family transporter, partial [Dolichospermum sp.]